MVGILPAVHDLRTNTSLFTFSPGRFLAANEIKAILAYIIATYDVKFEEGQGIPRGVSHRCNAYTWECESDVQDTTEVKSQLDLTRKLFYSLLLILSSVFFLPVCTGGISVTRLSVHGHETIE